MFSAATYVSALTGRTRLARHGENKLNAVEHRFESVTA